MTRPGPEECSLGPGQGWRDMQRLLNTDQCGLSVKACMATLVLLEVIGGVFWVLGKGLGVCRGGLVLVLLGLGLYAGIWWSSRLEERERMRSLLGVKTSQITLTWWRDGRGVERMLARLTPSEHEVAHALLANHEGTLFELLQAARLLG